MHSAEKKWILLCNDSIASWDRKWTRPSSEQDATKSLLEVIKRQSAPIDRFNEAILSVYCALRRQVCCLARVFLGPLRLQSKTVILTDNSRILARREFIAVILRSLVLPFCKLITRSRTNLQFQQFAIRVAQLELESSNRGRMRPAEVWVS